MNPKRKYMKFLYRWVNEAAPVKRCRKDLQKTHQPYNIIIYRLQSLIIILFCDLVVCLYICCKTIIMIKRFIEKEIQKIFSLKKAIIIYGARQVGKTTLTNRLLADYKDKTIIFNGDEPDIRILFEKAGSIKLKNLIGPNSFVVIDEAQKITDIGAIVKLIHDNIPDVQLFVTGSSSFDIANYTKESMTGRKLEFILYPLIFSELVEKHGLLHEKRMLDNRLVYGSYPEIVTHGNHAKRLLKSLASSYLYKDILTLESVKKPVLIEKLTKALALQIGSEVSYNELAGLLNADKSTIEKYIDILEKSFILFRLGSYSKNVRNELKKSRKIYFWDNGIRNAIIGNFSGIDQRTDSGALWENYLVSERLKLNTYLDKERESFFWRTTQQQEIDYVEVENGKIYAYEFKWSTHKKSKIPLTFRKAYKPVIESIINPDNYEDFLLADFKQTNSV